MSKKCTVCSSDALFQIKGTNDPYCQECAEEHFGDTSYLEKIETIEHSVVLTQEEDTEED